MSSRIASSPLKNRLKRWLLLLLAATAVAQTPAKPGSVEGSVSNALTGAPIGDAAVTIQSSYNALGIGNPYRYIAVTDEKGFFRIPAVDPGRYSSRVEAQGYMMPPDDGRRPTFQSLTIAEDQHITGLAFQLIPFGAVSGRIVNEDGEPLRNVKMQALQYTWNAAGKRLNSIAKATTDDRGRYRLRSLPPGRYLIRAFSTLPAHGPMNTPITSSLKKPTRPHTIRPRPNPRRRLPLTSNPVPTSPASISNSAPAPHSTSVDASLEAAKVASPPPRAIHRTWSLILRPSLTLAGGSST